MKKIHFILIILVICSNFIFSDNSLFKFNLLSTENQSKEFKRAKALKITGLVLLCTGLTAEVVGTAFATWQQIDPANAPGSSEEFHYNSSVFGNYTYRVNFLVIAFGTAGALCCMAGLPLLIVGAVKLYKIKKGMKNESSLLQTKYTPEFNFNFATNEIILGLNIKI